MYSNVVPASVKQGVLRICRAAHPGTLTWMFHMLGANPDIEAKLCQEIAAKLHGDAPAYDDLSPTAMPYSDSCIFSRL